jgi:hypothetical protein
MECSERSGNSFAESSSRLVRSNGGLRAMEQDLQLVRVLRWELHERIVPTADRHNSVCQRLAG